MYATKKKVLLIATTGTCKIYFFLQNCLYCKFQCLLFIFFRGVISIRISKLFLIPQWQNNHNNN